MNSRLASLASLAWISLVACSDKARPNVNSNPGATVDAGYTYVDAPLTCTAMGVLCDGQMPYRCSNNARVFSAPCTGERPFCHDRESYCERGQNIRYAR